MEQLALRRASKLSGPHVIAVVKMSAGANLKAIIHQLIQGAGAYNSRVVVLVVVSQTTGAIVLLTVAVVVMKW